MAAGYILAHIEVSDPEAYDRYRALAGKAVAAAGGEFLVRGGRCETLEGEWQPKRLVVLRFPSYERAKEFYSSALYEEARAARAGATHFFDMVVVEGG